jgi:hypothetical protein
MTQANNRRADWAGVTPLTAAEINALDQRRQDPGTESNRARAARGGWGSGDVLSAAMVREAVSKLADNAGLTPMRFDPGPGCDQTLRFHWCGEDYTIPLLASDTAADMAAKVAAVTGGKVSGGTVTLPVPARPQPGPAPDRLAEIRAAFAPVPPARVGFTCPPLALGESAILRLDTTGPEPVGSVSRDGGQTWEDAPRWPTGATTAHTATGGRIAIGAADGSGARPLPAPLAEAERLYGKGSPVWEAVRWAERHPGYAVELVGHAPPQPDPAPGQVWLPPPGDYTPGQLDADGTLTIDAVDGDTLRFGGRQSNARIGAKALANGGGWTCIGVATPHGRVLLGDAFRPDADAPEWTVSAVGYPPGTVVLSRSDAGSCSNDAAHVAARWQRTRYAPARAGERLRRRTNGAVYTVTLAGGLVILDAPSSARDVYDAGPGGWAADPAQWERLDAGTAQRSDDAHRDGQTIRIKRPASVVEAERARAVGVVDAESDVALRDRCIAADWRRAAKAPGLDAAKGAALDAIASGMGIERRAAVQPSGVATDALGREFAFDYGGNIKGPP